MNKQNKQMDVSEGEEVMGIWLNLVLKCLPEKSVKNVRLDIRDELDHATVRDLKELIQHEFRIARSFQNLYHDGRALLDECATLAQQWIREEDVITVEYDTTADVEKMFEVVRLIGKVGKVVEQNIARWCAKGVPPVSVPKIFSLGTTNDIGFITEKYCLGSSLRSLANRRVFASYGGYAHLLHIYGLVLEREYDDLPFFLRQLEGVLVRVLGDTLTNNGLRGPEERRLVIEHSALKVNLRSFLRRTVSPDAMLESPPGCNDRLEVDISTQRQQLAAIIKDAQINLSELVQVPALRMKVASNEACMAQLMAMGLSPTFDSSAVVVLINTLISLARCRDAHVELTSVRVLEGVFDVLKRKLQNKYCFNTTIHLIFRQSTITLFTLLLAESAHIIPLPLKLKIATFVSNVFLQDIVQPVEYYQSTSTEDLVWAFLSLVYSPKDFTEDGYTESHNNTMKQLREICLKIGLLNMHDEILADKKAVRDIIKEDFLTDYLTCLPWYLKVDGRLQKKMEVLMELACAEVPSLQNMCKAKLARAKFGLEKVLFLSVQEMAFDDNNNYYEF